MPADLRSVTVEDIEYIRHGGRSMILRLFRPEGISRGARPSWRCLEQGQYRRL